MAFLKIENIFIQFPLLIAVNTFALFTGNYLAFNSEATNNSQYFGIHAEEGKINFIGEIVTPLLEKKNSIYAELDVKQVERELTTGKLIVYFEKDTNVEKLVLGDEIIVSAYVNPIVNNSNPSSFKYANYQRVKNFYHQSYLNAKSWRLHTHNRNPFQTAMLNFRNYFIGVLDKSGMSKNERSVAKALILGEKEELNTTLKSNYAASGAMHILAVSGLHVGIVMLFFSILLKPLKRIRFGVFLHTFIIISLLWLYAIITGSSPSVLRASFMFSFIVIAQNLQREQITFQAIIVSAFFLIILRPYIVFEVGFQLSYAAVTGIIFIQPKLFKLLRFKFKISNYIWGIITVSVAAQIATLPLSIYYFHQFPTYFLITNIVVIPLAFVTLLLGIIFLATSWIPYLNSLTLLSLESTVWLLNNFIETISDWPKAILSSFHLLKIEVLTIYGALIGLTAFCITRKRSTIFIFSASAVLLLSFSLNHALTESKRNTITFYDVKEGNAIDIRSGIFHRFYCDSKVLNNQTSFSYNILPHWIATVNGNPPGSIKNFEKIKKIHVGNRTISTYKNNSLNTSHDILYIAENSFIDSAELNLMRTTINLIILGVDCRFKMNAFLKKEIGDKVHHLKFDGALVMEITSEN